MKKERLKAAALTMIFASCAAACSDTAVPEDIAEEPQVVDYDINNAREITVNITNSNDEPPVELHELAIPDFGEKCPACSDNGELYKGTTRAYAIDGDYIYFSVDYDKFDYYYHETAILKYNIQTGEMTEFYTHSTDNECGECYPRLIVVGNKLYACCVDYCALSDSSLVEFDLESGQKKIISSGISWYNIYSFENELYLVSYADDTDDIQYILSKYKPETGGWETINERYSGEVCFGDVMSMSYMNEDDCTTFEVKDRFTLKTNKKNITLAGADENHVRWTLVNMHESYTETYLCSFNTRSQEICKLNMPFNYTQIVFMGDGCVVLPLEGINTKVKYILPEIGMTFNLTDTGRYSCLSYDNGIISFCEFETGEYEKLYWIEAEE